MWSPTLGAVVRPDGTRFTVWAPAAERLDVVIDDAGGRRTLPMSPGDAGYFTAFDASTRAGARYRYRLNGDRLLPDPASRFQPEGVHGPSEVIDPSAFRWTDANWQGPARERLAIYELHVGTFSPAGTFDGVRERLSHLADLGVTAVEIMPVADFSGDRNWGYDGVDLFAPSRAYGRPDDLRRLVDAAHGLGLAVLLDVVYNHVGPEGAYLGAFAPAYFTNRHHTPWGDAINLDGPGCREVRRFFIESALHWLHEYHIDGFRLDATHAIVDDSRPHFLSELADRVHAERPEALVIAEDERKLPELTRPAAQGGWGLDGVWADDLHHHLRRGLAGDREGYFAAFTGDAADIALTLDRGWWTRKTLDGRTLRAADSAATEERSRFIVCVQNHDQVGNRALGERLHHQIDPAAFRAAVTLVLLAPETPLLFMGQEWAASSPFLYFTDHPEPLGSMVTAGRRREFQAFSAFADPAARDRIPDPQALETFERSRLRWDEPLVEPHASYLRLHRRLLALRRTHPAYATAGACAFTAHAPDEDSVVFRCAQSRDAATVVIRLRAGGTTVVPPELIPSRERSTVVLSTEDADLVADSAPIGLDRKPSGLHARFVRPGAIVVATGA